MRGLDSAAAVPALAITHIRIERDRALFDIALAAQAPRYTNPALAAHVVNMRPHLPDHACVNVRSRAGECAPLFANVIEDTSLPHVLEHVAIDVLTDMALQSQGAECAATAAPSRTFVGTSEWLDEQAGTARVALSYRDDLEVLAAVNEAVRIVNACVARWQSQQ